MKLLIVLAAVTALCAGNAIPIIPKDNSHYVEGESRYIWMPDGEGVPHLVDLHEPVNYNLLQSRNGANNRYLLYTRQNRANPQIIVHGNANSILNSNYQGNRPTKVVVHGWMGNGEALMNSLIALAFLDLQDCNVIVLDWGGLANGLYVTAVAGIPSVGQFAGNFLTWLIGTAGGNWNNVHLIGASLGAHVIGNIGRTTGSRPARITGLDPAGPLWASNSNALNANDGQYVEAIHTDGGLLGIFNRIADADFYPNGGRHPQPGCLDSYCSHARSVYLYVSSIYNDRFVGRRCANINLVGNPDLCVLGTLNMGNGVITKRGSGIYSLRTGSVWPF